MINFKYLPQKEILKKRNHVTNFKANFLAKLEMLKYKGQYMETYGLIENWL